MLYNLHGNYGFRVQFWVGGLGEALLLVEAELGVNAVEVARRAEVWQTDAKLQLLSEGRWR